MIIAPSLLSCNFLRIEEELNSFVGFQNLWFHLDIMDGHFVPNMTFGIPIVEMISKKTSIPLDAHLMVTNPEFHIEKMKHIPLHNLTFHVEATDNVIALLHEAKKYFKNVGLSIKPNTKVSELTLQMLRALDLVLVMSVEPGFGGQSFMPNSLDKIRELKKIKEEHQLNFQIQVDGGINEETAKLVRDAGADNLVAGNYIFKDGPAHYSERINSLK